MSWELLHHFFDGSALVSEKSPPKHFSASESSWLAWGFVHCYFEIFYQLVVGLLFQKGGEMEG